jgi:hypothetical protein
MFLDKFYTGQNNQVQFSRQQASDFAKQVADDFNPLHDIDAKRFCVPGDLLFSLVLSQYGLSQKMAFGFSGMVSDEVTIILPNDAPAHFPIIDVDGKEYLDVNRSGQTTTNPELIEDLIRSYVAFSGQTFPDILVPLLAEQNVMINPDRPLVIYEKMSLEFNHLDISSPELESTTPTLTLKGKRGNVCLSFRLMAEGKEVGHGEKWMVMSGLREYDKAKCDELVEGYHVLKDTYTM